MEGPRKINKNLAECDLGAENCKLLHAAIKEQSPWDEMGEAGQRDQNCRTDGGPEEHHTGKDLKVKPTVAQSKC